MKELSIEEKAKRYDDRLEKARKWYDANTNEGYKGIFEDIFPELKESEGERMWKLIKKYAHSNISDMALNADHITREQLESWLEKQGEKKSLDDIAKEVIKDKDTAISFLKSTGIINENGELADEYKIEQGEQKPVDKIEQNFKAGDWVVCGQYGVPCQIESIKDGRYYFTSGIGIPVESVNIDYHLWTIQDAKDGDVLAIDDGNIFVFDGTVEEDKYPFAYYGLTRRRFESYDRRLPFTHNNVHPATKEQRDILFQKMKEACYEWDDEKKELKKNEPMPTAEGMKIISRTKCEFAEWSEEDEKMLNKILAVVTLYYGYNGNVLDKQSCTSFLKSLKDRYTWKPSDEQMEVLEELVEDNNQRYFYTILRSLYEQLKKLKG